MYVTFKDIEIVQKTIDLLLSSGNDKTILIHDLYKLLQKLKDSRKEESKTNHRI